MSESDFSEGYSSFEDEDFEMDSEPAVAKYEDVRYSYPDAMTSTKVPINRIKYQDLTFEDVEALLRDKVESLDGIIRIGFDECLILLMALNWKTEKVLEAYLENPPKLYKTAGLLYGKQRQPSETLVVSETYFFCSICCSEASAEEPLTSFHAGQCDHKFCAACYATYLNNKTSLICMEVGCNTKILPSELKVLSDYILEHEHVLEEEDSVQPKETSEFFNYTVDNEVDDEIEEVEEEQEEDALQFLVEYRKRQQERSAKDKEIQRNRTLHSRFWSRLVKQHVEQQPDFRLCPATDCQGIVRFMDFDSNCFTNGITSLEQFAVDFKSFPIVQCSYNHHFCFYCGKDNHLPCPCPFIKAWIKKCKDDSETANWIENNTKSCPTCESPIEKNGGCNHMTCKKCRYEFCWICMGKWSDHKDYYKCSRYREVQEDEQKKKNSRRYLERYLFYYNRFATHQTSFKKDKAFCSTLDFLIQKVQKKNRVSWIETQFYEEAVQALLKGRHTLMWSYAFLYYVETSNSKSLIEDAQDELAKAVENLSKLVETVKPENIMKSRQKFITESGLCKSHQYVLIDISIEALSTKNLPLFIPQ